jgi:hypothetical protein
MALRLHPEAGPAQLEALTGLSRHTVLSGIGQAKAWRPASTGPRAQVPAALLASRPVGAQAKVLYGLLQATEHFRGQSGQVSYTNLCSLTGLGRNTLKRAMAALVSAGWVQASQENQLSPIHFTLGRPEWVRSRAEAAVVRRRLKRARFGGEALMQEYLSLLVDSDQFTDNARPGFLVNPLTRERLELDRFYPPKVAFEFHGAQHFHQTDRFSREEVEAQQLRDFIKAGICLYQGIHLVVVRAEDLSLETMRKKIGRSLPIRDLTDQETLIDLLEEASLAYRGAALSAHR